MKKIGELVTVTDEEYLHLIGFLNFTKFPRTPNECITQKTTYWTGFACEYKIIVSKVKISLRFLFLLNLLEITFLICWFWEIFLRILVFAGLSQISKHSVLWYTIGITPCSSGCPFARNTLILSQPNSTSTSTQPQPQLELELDLIMGRNPPHPTPPPHRNF